jgi:hypothetical protein
MTEDPGSGLDSSPASIARLALVAALLIACGRSKDPRPAKVSTSTPAAEPAGAVVETNSKDIAHANACPRTGLWAACSVERRLEQAGFVVTKTASTPRRPGFSVAPIAYKLGRGKLEAFIYPDAKALQRDWANLDTLSASPRGKPTRWELPPSVVRSVNLAAVYLTDSPVQAERLALALTAGAPQPRSAVPSASQMLPTIEVRPRK